MSAEIDNVLVRLAALEAREIIRDLLTGIARGLDRYDGALLSACIWPDATLDLGGAAPMSGVDFAAAIKPPAEPRPGRMHVLSNPRIVLDGEAAHSECQIVSWQDVLVDGVRQTRVRAGRYLDRFSCRDGEWRLTSRILIDEWGRIDPVTSVPPQGTRFGRPAPEDLSYTL